MGGIPVPGRTVPILRLFEHYGASCRPKSRSDFRMDQLAEIMSSLNAEDVAKKVYSQLFHSMGDVQLEKLMGKWYTVSEEQTRPFRVELLTSTEFTGTFSSLLYASHNGEVVTYQGFGRMTGPEPGEVLYTTGHQSDQCPYFPVKMGGLNSRGEYEYIIFSQPLKYPSMVLARDLSKFEQKYQQEVYKFLEKHGYLSPLSSLNTRLHFENSTSCIHSNRYYDQMEL
ncbi:unnamed protein product [Heligmosomoides polygyrus]|uniref:DUF3991 domain-containing protein n=1 Tax=Heligmosomoides polygyrus TaxID=6339 RepID=A0A3P7TF83_HELPZ|nr:unnamed protein product [Heligmosomoides polygyrus]